MNASDIIKYGDQTVQRMLNDIPPSHWDTPNVCGWWSIKNILAHLASFEHLLAEVLRPFGGASPTNFLADALRLPADAAATPYLDQMQSAGGQAFNDDQVGRRQSLTSAEALVEYAAAHAENMRLAALIPAETLRLPATLPWYGLEYALDDLIVYQYYGHKREHMAQVGVFKDSLKL